MHVILDSFDVEGGGLEGADGGDGGFGSGDRGDGGDFVDQGGAAEGAGALQAWSHFYFRQPRMDNLLFRDAR